MGDYILLPAPMRVYAYSSASFQYSWRVGWELEIEISRKWDLDPHTHTHTHTHTTTTTQTHRNRPRKAPLPNIAALFDTGAQSHVHLAEAEWPIRVAIFSKNQPINFGGFPHPLSAWRMSGEGHSCIRGGPWRGPSEAEGIRGVLKI